MPCKKGAKSEGAVEVLRVVNVYVLFYRTVSKDMASRDGSPVVTARERHGIAKIRNVSGCRFSDNTFSVLIGVCFRLQNALCSQK
jgi:hypothetical protein